MKTDSTVSIYLSIYLIYVTALLYYIVRFCASSLLFVYFLMVGAKSILLKVGIPRIKILGYRENIGTGVQNIKEPVIETQQLVRVEHPIGSISSVFHNSIFRGLFSWSWCYASQNNWRLKTRSWC